MSEVIKSLIQLIKKFWGAMGAALIYLLVIELGMLGINRTIKYFSNEPQVYCLLDERAPVPESYVTTDWYTSYVEEFKQASTFSWKPYVYWRTSPFQGKYINIGEDNLRKTWNPKSQDVDVIVFMFGGSTIWGWGARDDYTIPSLLSKILFDEYQIKAKVINYGEVGYVSTQEVIALMTLLQKNNRPNFVIFLDGLNDICSTLRTGQLGMTGVPWNELERKRSFHLEQAGVFKQLVSLYAQHSFLYSGFIQAMGTIKQKEPLKEHQATLISEIMKVYLENIKTVDALAKSYHFESLFYWQPTITTKKTLTPYEKELEEAGEHLLKARVIFKGVNALISTQNTVIRDMTNILSDDEESYYIDYFHTNEKGNEKVARKMAIDLVEKLQKSDYVPNPLGKNSFVFGVLAYFV